MEETTQIKPSQNLPDTFEEARNREVEIDGQKIVFKERATLLPAAKRSLKS